MSNPFGSARDAQQYVYGTTRWDGEKHPAVYCRRCGKCLNVEENRVGWCRACDLVEALVYAGRYGIIARPAGGKS
jgi:hypothetical protein